MEDVLNLKSVLDEIPQADISKIFMLGTSRGGMMTYLAVSQVDWIKAAVSVSGTANVSRSYQLRPELNDFRSDMCNVDNEEEIQKRSAVYWGSKFNPNTPIFSCMELLTSK